MSMCKDIFRQLFRNFKGDISVAKQYVSFSRLWLHSLLSSHGFWHAALWSAVLLWQRVLVWIQYECLGKAKYKRRRLLFSFDPGVNCTSEALKSRPGCIVRPQRKSLSHINGQRRDTTFFLSIKLPYNVLYSISVTFFPSFSFPLVH